MKFTIEFEFLSLSSMNSDSEFSSGLFPVLLFLFNFFLRKILKEQEVQLPPFKMPHTVPMQPLMSYPFMASVLSWILGWQWWMITSSSRHCHVRFWWLLTGRNPGRFGWSFLLVTPCLTSASSIIQQLFEKGGACKQHPLIVPMVFDANLEFEFLSLSSMNSDSEFSFGLFCVVLNL